MIINLIFGSVVIFIFIAFILVIRDSIRREGRWGINLEKVRCPRCGNKSPNFRLPESLHQTLWGGWHCTKCGCEVNKWGKEIDGKVITPDGHRSVHDQKDF